MEHFEVIKQVWLNEKHGVFVLCFVGFFAGEHLSFSLAVYRTLLEVFANVKCYRDKPLDVDQQFAGNIHCFATDYAPAIQSFQSTQEVKEPPDVSMWWIAEHFRQWEVFNGVHTEEQPITLNTDLSEFEPTLSVISSSMQLLTQRALGKHIHQADT